MKIIKFLGLVLFIPIYFLFGFPSEFLFGSILMLLLSYYIPIIIYKKSGDSFNDIKTFYFFFFLINIIFAFLNCYVSFKNGSVTHPWIYGSDPETYYLMAQDFALNKNFDVSGFKGLYIGYPLFIGLVFKALGSFLLIGLFVNILASGIIFFTTIRISEQITIEPIFQKRIAMFIIISPHLLSLGSILLKDVWITMAILVAVLCILKVMQDKIRLNYLLILMLSTITIGLFRGTYMIIPLLLPLFLRSRKSIKILISLTVIIYITYIIVSDINPYLKDLNSVYSTNIADDYSKNWTTGLTGKILGGYSNWNTFTKLLYLPITITIQLVQPYEFWKLSLLNYPWEFLQRTMMSIWLIYFLPRFFHRIFTRFNQLSSCSQLKGLALWFLFSFSISAFIYGGTIPRYGIPFLPILFIILAYLENINSSKI